ncbi:MAG: hypothetical protein FJ279_38100 [Planctomycetes bacterium]|nr:hypothetical protein [Planctomycetota bacterium]MBM4081916.1 hypothetical protein [Planctomycetota bacterium]
MGDPPDYKPVTRQIDEVSRTLKNWTPPGRRPVDGDVLANFTFGDREPTLESVHDQPGCRVTALRVPPSACFDPVTNDRQGRRGFSVACRLGPRGSERDTFEFTLRPAGDSRHLKLTVLRAALWREAGSPCRRLTVEARIGTDKAPQALGALDFGEASASGWQERALAIPSSFPGVEGEVTVRLLPDGHLTPALVRLDDLKLHGFVRDADEPKEGAKP